MLNVKEVAASLHVSPREVVRLAEKKILPGALVRGEWQFRAGEVWNWIEKNLDTLPERRKKDRDPEPAAAPLIAPVLNRHAIHVSLLAKTKSSVLRELAQLAEIADSSIDPRYLYQSLMDRETKGTTALQDGVAIPHPARPLHLENPVLAIARTAQGVVFGQRDGGLTDLFFLVCCPTHTDHLLYLGRLCRLLVDRKLLAALREADDADAFLSALTGVEKALCRQ